MRLLLLLLAFVTLSQAELPKAKRIVFLGDSITYGGTYIADIEAALIAKHPDLTFELLNLGLTDALRACTDQGGLYTFWDYQAGAWPRNNGIRIDHLLLSPQAADRLTGFAIDKHMRALEKPSDHVPIRIDLS